MAPALHDIADLLATIKNARGEAAEVMLDVAGIDYHIDRLTGQIAELQHTRRQMLAQHESIRCECQVTELALSALIAELTDPERIADD